MSTIRILALVALIAISHLPTAQAESDIVDTAVAADGFNTLVAAVKAADLVGTLKSDGPFTVFAPTDEAFAKLPAGTVEILLKPENRDQLVSVLTYHVIAGKISAKKVVRLSAAETVQGSDVRVRVNDGQVTINDAKVVATDIECTNGLIHVIDQVILPPSMTAAEEDSDMEMVTAAPDIVDTAVGAGSFNTLMAAVKAAGLVDTLKGPGPFTVLAPTDDAFGKLPAGTIDTLLKPENKAKLANILTYHVIPGKVLAKDVVKLSSANTVQGSSVRIKTVNGGVKINDANVVKTDIECANGVIHVIDSVILPPEKVSRAAPVAVINDAIHRGVPMYNSGHHCECAHIYSFACMELVMKHEKMMPANVKKDLMGALDEAKHTASADARAWVLRRCLDRTMTAMQ